MGYREEDLINYLYPYYNINQGSVLYSPSELAKKHSVGYQTFYRLELSIRII